MSTPEAVGERAWPACHRPGALLLAESQAGLSDDLEKRRQDAALLRLVGHRPALDRGLDVRQGGKQLGRLRGLGDESVEAGRECG